MNKIVYISDYLIEELIGGAELNDHELITLLRQEERDLEVIKSINLTERKILDNIDSFYIISNFTQINRELLNVIAHNVKYLIYEHDHKYLASRDPSIYQDYKAPRDQIINEYFYSNAIAILCQSKFQENILKLNLPNVNTINLSGNLWSLESLELLRSLNVQEKTNLCSIIDSKNWHKNTKGSIDYCINNNIFFELIKEQNYKDFLVALSKNRKFIFLPKTPETLSRIVVESRMLNISVITNNKVGATYEEWFALKGDQLIDFMISKRKEILSKVLEVVN